MTMYQPFMDSFLRMIADSAICDEYYRICDTHSTDPTEPVKINARAVLKATSDKISLRKLAGPGIVYEVNDMPESTKLGFVLHRAGTVETYFSVRYKDVEQSDTFAILCFMALTNDGRPVRNPPYPRPVYASIDELIIVFQEASALMRSLIELCDRS